MQISENSPNPSHSLTKEQVANLIVERKRELKKAYVAKQIEERKQELKQEYERSKQLPQEEGISLVDRAMEGVRQVGRLGRGAATGLASLGDIPNLGAMGLHAAGLKETPEFYPSPSQSIRSGIDWVTGDKLKPRNKTEEYVDSVVEGAAPFLLGPVTGGASLGATAAKTAAKHIPKATGLNLVNKLAQSSSTPYKLSAANLGANIGASTATKTYMDNVKDPGIFGGLGAGLVGSVLGGKGAGIGAQYRRGHNIAGRPDLKAPHSKAYNDLKSLDIPMSVSDVTSSEFPTNIDLLLAKAPGSSNIMQKYIKNKQEKFAKHLGRTGPEPLEKSHISSEELVKQGAKGYGERIGDIFNKLKKPIKAKEQEALTNHSPIDITDIHTELLKKQQPLKSPTSIKKHEGETPGYFRKETEKYAQDYEKNAALSAKEIDILKKEGHPQHVIDKIIENSSGSKKLEIPYGEFEQLRNEALALMKKDMTPQNVQTHELFRNAREKFMEKIGTPEEKRKFLKANKLYSSYKSNASSKESIADLVENIKKAPDDTKAFEKLFSTNPKYANIVMSGLPKNERRTLTDALISKLGSESNGKFNINKAHTQISKVEKPVLDVYLRGFNQTEKRNFHKSLDLIGKNKERYEKLANTSNTAHTLHVMDNMMKLGAASWGAMTGNITPAVSYLGALLTTKGTAKLWTNQTFVKQFDRLNTARTKSQKIRAADHLLQNPSVRQILSKEKND